MPKKEWPSGALRDVFWLEARHPFHTTIRPVQFLRLPGVLQPSPSNRNQAFHRLSIELDEWDPLQLQKSAHFLEKSICVIPDDQLPYFSITENFMVIKTSGVIVGCKYYCCWFSYKSINSNSCWKCKTPVEYKLLLLQWRCPTKMLNLKIAAALSSADDGLPHLRGGMGIWEGSTCCLRVMKSLHPTSVSTWSFWTKSPLTFLPSMKVSKWKWFCELIGCW